jgi:hypothetical protein
MFKLRNNQICHSTMLIGPKIHMSFKPLVKMYMFSSQERPINQFRLCEKPRILVVVVHLPLKILLLNMMLKSAFTVLNTKVKVLFQGLHVIYDNLHSCVGILS